MGIYFAKISRDAASKWLASNRHPDGVEVVEPGGRYSKKSSDTLTAIAASGRFMAAGAVIAWRDSAAGANGFAEALAMAFQPFACPGLFRHNSNHCSACGEHREGHAEHAARAVAEIEERRAALKQHADQAAAAKADAEAEAWINKEYGHTYTHCPVHGLDPAPRIDLDNARWCSRPADGQEDTVRKMRITCGDAPVEMLCQQRLQAAQ